MIPEEQLIVIGFEATKLMLSLLLLLNLLSFDFQVLFFLHIHMWACNTTSKNSNLVECCWIVACGMKSKQSKRKNNNNDNDEWANEFVAVAVIRGKCIQNCMKHEIENEWLAHSEFNFVFTDCAIGSDYKKTN